MATAVWAGTEAPTEPRFALQPVVLFNDRLTHAYRLLVRAGDPLEAVAAAAPLCAPAALLAPVGRGRAADLVRRLPVAVDPRTVVAVLAREDAGSSDAVEMVAELRAHGLRVGVEGVAGDLGRLPLAVTSRLDLIVLHRAVVRGIADDPHRRALVVALTSLAGTVGSRVIADGVDDERDILTLLNSGVQSGCGDAVGEPVTLHDAHAGDLVVDVAWFAQQDVRGMSDGPPTEKVSTVRDVAHADEGRPTLARALSDAARALQSELDPRRIVEVIAERLARVVPVDRLVVYEADADRQRFVPLVTAGADAERMAEYVSPLSTGITGWAFANGLAINVGDVINHPLCAQVPGVHTLEESLLIVPLVAGDRKLGVVDCWRLGIDRFTDEDLEAVALFAHIAAAAWRNAQLYAELNDRAMTDPLTGLHNLRWWIDAGRREATQAMQRDGSVAVLLIDLDHFKLINDSGGHAAGDVALRRVARALSGLVRDGDALVRFGGEELLLVLHGAGEPAALRVAAAVRQALRGVEVPPCGVDRITASIGVAVHPRDGGSIEEVVERADAAMYAAKRAGRDRVVVASATG